jgi:hypothetical protein
MDILSKFNEEISEDVKIDQINILEKQLMLPAIKHKWVARLIREKRNKSNLERRKKDLKDEVLKAMSKEIPTGIPKASLNFKVESSEVIKKINEEIADCDLLIEYLEKVEKIFSSFTYDIGNATKLMVLETT